MDLHVTIHMPSLLAGVGRRRVNDVMRDAFREAGHFFADKFLMKRFTRAGARELGFTPRKGENVRAGGKRFAKYAGPEEKRAGEILPFVFGGELKTQAQAYNVDAVATSNRVYVQITLPRANKLNLVKQPYRAEFYNVSPAETAAVVEFINERLQVGLDAMVEECAARQTVTIS